MLDPVKLIFLHEQCRQQISKINRKEIIYLLSYSFDVIQMKLPLMFCPKELQQL